MPWKFIFFLIICIIFAIFVTANLDNKANISFIFAEFSQVPVFLIVIFSFVFGSCTTLLAMLLANSKKRRKKKAQQVNSHAMAVAEDKETDDGQRLTKRNARRRS